MPVLIDGDERLPVVREVPLLASIHTNVRTSVSARFAVVDGPPVFALRLGANTGCSGDRALRMLRRRIVVRCTVFAVEEVWTPGMSSVMAHRFTLVN
ncbi:hypothetical protein FEK35_11980 [Nocardia cyriacigeorgica]|uniref:Uncharacterized protein n=1 Tax=Nocardia cyriacigeorgica TaxID=135487 RepID=A0A5R8PFP4_9NOCA|nr:hypothetical protein [Nocardia cyriacigeorgica]TLG12215.1 hypothetical protein FEK35_11980 [Nocardia cyriacigeorgica]